MSTTHHHHHPSNLLTKITIRPIYLFLPLSLLLLLLYLSPSSLGPTAPSPSHDLFSVPTDESPIEPCNYAAGRWVPDGRGPAYNHTSCATIKQGQNCLENGRPDTGYLHWRWQPHGCRLPRFNPAIFLRLIANKHVAFVGDSMARNQVESLLCLLAADSLPELVYGDRENKFRRWLFRAHNATVSVFWSPFLVEGVEKSTAADLNHNKLYVNLADQKWAAEMAGADVVLFSAGHWFLHPAVFFDGGKVIGCHHCPELNHTEIGFFDVYRKAVRTALTTAKKKMTTKKKKKYVLLVTFSPSHFEGEWDKAGACGRKEPYEEGKKDMEYMDKEMWKIQVEEAAATAEGEINRGGVTIETLDVTKMATMRPDGHPGPYMNPHPFAGGPNDRVQNDCVHWCLPGPIDAWNEVLLQMIMRYYKEL